jgi:5-aminopentanamidase
MRAVVACCQLVLSVEDPAGNRARLAAAIERAAAAGANIVVLPELAITGYRFESRAEVAAVAEDRDGITIRDWHRLAARHDLVIVGGFVEAGEGVFHNSAAVVDASGLRAIYRKVHLWDREREWFSPGAAAPPVLETRFGRIGVVICYDLEFPEWVRMAALAGAELLCAPVNWPLFPRPTGERPAEVIRVQADAAVNRMFVAACDRAGTERGTEWLGGAVIVDPDGFPLTELRLGTEDTVMTTIDLAEAVVKTIGDRNDVFADRRPELYRGL